MNKVESHAPAGQVLQHFDLPQKGAKISALHGQQLEAKADYGDVAIVPLYHPAAALYNRNLRGTLEQDFKVLEQFI